MCDSLQCGRQITQLMDEYEEAKKTLEEEAVKLRKVRPSVRAPSHDVPAFPSPVM